MTKKNFMYILENKMKAVNDESEIDSISVEMTAWGKELIIKFRAVVTVNLNFDK